jgi:hypothetical protein
MSGLTDFRYKFGRVVAASWYQFVIFATESAHENKFSSDKEHASKRTEDKITVLRRILRKFPYWSGGHLLLGALQLSCRKQLGAYSSALAAKKLRPDDDISARYLMARVYLSSGKGAEALLILESLNQQFPQRYDIIEDLAAAQMQVENNMAALSLLESIPEQLRSKESEAVLRYLRQKVQ